MAKLFISYSRKDVWAQELGRKLRNNEVSQHDVFVDYRDIHVGVNFWDVICEKIEQCDALIYVLSPDSVKSIYCLAEVRYALALNKPILPLMLRECEFPQFLNDRTINYRQVPREMSDVLLLIERSLSEFHRNEARNPQAYTMPNPRPARPPQPRADESQKTEIQRMIDVAKQQNETELVNQLMAQLQAIIHALTPQALPVAKPKSSSRTPLLIVGIVVIVIAIIGIIAILNSGGNDETTPTPEATIQVAQVTDELSPTTASETPTTAPSDMPTTSPTVTETPSPTITPTPSDTPTEPDPFDIAAQLIQTENAGTETQVAVDMTATATQWTLTPSVTPTQTPDATQTVDAARAILRAQTQSAIETQIALSFTPTFTITPDNNQSIFISHTYTPLPDGCILHTLQAGEFPSFLSVTYGVSFLDIMNANNLTEEDARLLRVGTVLIIPLEDCPKELLSELLLDLSISIATQTSVAEQTMLSSTIEAMPTITLVPTVNSSQLRVQIVEVTGVGDITREQVVIRNHGNLADISGWTLSDGQGNVFTFPNDRRLFAEAGVTINTRSGENTPVVFFWGRDLPAFESGDVVVLRNRESEVIFSLRLP